MTLPSNCAPLYEATMRTSAFVRPHLLLLFLAGTFTLAACGSDNTGGTDPTPVPDTDGDTGAGDTASDAPTSDAADDTTPDAAPTCTESADCVGGERCVAGSCRPVCDDETPCEGALPFCDPVLGVCVGCTDDVDCPLGRVCDPDALVCVPDADACQSNRDCPGGFTCRDERCVPIDPIICEPSTALCDEGALVVCSADGTRAERTPCAPDGLCDDPGDGRAECLPFVCEPNGIGCLDADSAFFCDTTGTVATPVPCDGAFYCTEGVCRPQVCPRDEARCEGTTQVLCDALGATQTRTDCATDPACDAELGCTCAAGACVERICTPGAGRCVGATPETCADDGTRWVADAACDATSYCLEGTCLPTVCEPGSVTCAGETLVTCNADGSTRTQVNCASTSRVCDDGAAVPSCVARTCTPNERRCSASNVGTVCDARGVLLTTNDCGDANYCQSGECFPRVCTPGAPATCVGGDVRQCNANGSAFELVTACPAGSSLCVDGACAPIVCTPGSLTCAGDVLRRCSDDGLEVVTENCAASGDLCEAGACVAPVCDPSVPPTCEAGNVVGCSNRGLTFGVIQTCRNGACSNGVCDDRCGDGVLDPGEECDLAGANGPGSGCSADCTLELDSLCEGAATCVTIEATGATRRRIAFNVPSRPLDVVFNLDASPSMQSDIAEIQRQYVPLLLPAFQSVATGVRAGVSSFNDFPCAPFSSAPEVPFRLEQRVTSDSGAVALALARITTTLGSSSDLRMSGTESLYQLATGSGRVEPFCSPTPWQQAAFNPTLGRVNGVADGPEGGAGFRTNAQRVVVHVIDNEDNARGVELAYTYGASRPEAWRALRAAGIRVVAIEGPGSFLSEVPLQLRELARATDSRVPPCFWGASRPAGCTAGQCCTGPSGAGVATDSDGLCALAYDRPSTSAQLVLRIEEGVRALVQQGSWDVFLRPAPSATGAALPACLVDRIAAVSATAPSGATCSRTPVAARIAPGTGPNDGFRGVQTGGRLTFDLDFAVADCLPPSSGPRSFDLLFDLVTPDGHVLTQRPVRVVIPPTGTCTAAVCTPNTCGNGIREAGEICDDGNLVNGDGCSSTCRLETCGNGVTTYSNQTIEIRRPRLSDVPGGVTLRTLCDDGATCVHGECDLATRPEAPEHAICQAYGFERATRVKWGRSTGVVDAASIARAGDRQCIGFVCFPSPVTLPQLACGTWESIDWIRCAGRVEACDNGAANSDTVPGACRTNCLLPRCGDGVVDPGEACDDGNDDDFDFCTNQCTLPVCGDGIVQAGELCDDGVFNSDTIPGACRTTCDPASCGDFVVDPDEQCDDGPTGSATCSSTCELPSCGDGNLDPGEECDDGNMVNRDGCSNNCRLPVCGDGVRQGDEGCDAGAQNGQAGGVCRADCQPTAAFFDCIDDNLGSTVGPAVATGTTVGRTNSRESTCGGSARAPDISFLWTAPASAIWTFDTNTSGYDTVLHIYDASSTGTCDPVPLLCDDDGGEGTRSLIRRPLVAGDQIVIVVDGFGSTAAGNYVLNITNSGLLP